VGIQGIKDGEVGDREEGTMKKKKKILRAIQLLL